MDTAEKKAELKASYKKLKGSIIGTMLHQQDMNVDNAGELINVVYNMEVFFESMVDVQERLYRRIVKIENELNKPKFKIPEGGKPKLKVIKKGRSKTKK